MSTTITTIRNPLGEEIANSISHGLAALATIPASAFMLVKAAPQLSTFGLVSLSLFCGSLFFLFLMSTLYHSLSRTRSYGVFRRLDHSAIFLFIASTYTTLWSLSEHSSPLGWSVLASVWVLSIAGMVMKSFAMSYKFKKTSVVVFLLIGIGPLLVAPQVFQVFPTMSYTLLLIGGGWYCAGILFYALKSLPYAHFIWHLCVMAGATFHCLAIGVYILP